MPSAVASEDGKSTVGPKPWEKEVSPTADTGQIVFDDPYNEKDTRRLLRKIDFALIPFLAFLYLYLLPVSRINIIYG